VPHRTWSRVVLALLLPSRLVGQAAATTLYESADCPVPDFVKPYTIVARYDTTRSRDSTYFRQLANHTGGYLRDIPVIERRLALVAVLRRDGTLKASRMSAGSGDRDFDKLALRALRDAVHSGTLGPLPPDVQGDTLSVEVLFGEAPVAGEYAVRRFDRQWQLPRLLSDSVLLSYVTADSAVARRKGEAVLSTMVDTTGSPDTRTRVRQASSEALGLVARQLISHLRFEPGQSDCEPQSYEVWVRLTFNGHGVAHAQVVR
jgi:TonB C terminal